MEAAAAMRTNQKSHRASRKQEIPTALEAEQKHGAFTSVTENFGLVAIRKDLFFTMPVL